MRLAAEVLGDEGKAEDPLSELVANMRTKEHFLDRALVNVSAARKACLPARNACASATSLADLLARDDLLSARLRGRLARGDARVPRNGVSLPAELAALTKPGHDVIPTRIGLGMLATDCGAYGHVAAEGSFALRWPSRSVVVLVNQANGWDSGLCSDLLKCLRPAPAP
jgi:hypothetical protein